MRLFNPKVRTGQGSTRLSKEEFQRRWKERFYDPAFDPERDNIDHLAEIAWDAYDDHRKSPRTRKAGPEFADPEFELALEWLEARARIHAAQKEFEDPQSPSRILLISASPLTLQATPLQISESLPHPSLRPPRLRKRHGFTIDF